MPMKKYALYKLLKQNNNLRNLRHPMFERNKFMKFLGWFMFLYYAALLIFLGVALGLGMGEHGIAAFHYLDGGLPIIIIIDFWVRFILQETPAQTVRPYRLLPISRSFLMNVYLVSSGFSLGNLFWWFMLVPFGIISVMPLLGWGGLAGWLLGWWMLCVANGFAYLFIRSLCMKHLAWAALPALVHGIWVALMVLPKHNLLDMPCTELMYGFALWNPLPYMLGMLLVAASYWANYKLQLQITYEDVAQKEEVEMKTARDFSFFNRFGTLGEYLKMEMKLRLRNKQVRTQFFVGLGLMLFFTGMMYFTDVYDNAFMKSFICLYEYIILGLMTLVGIMCFEGNYIDGLMSRRESIYDLLCAKYYFNSIILLVPFLTVLPLTIIGKISIWMNLGYLFFTIGVIYPCIFQLAVYNKESIPLNQKLIGKQGNMMQQIVAIAALVLPLGIERISVLLVGPVWGYAPLVLLGIVGLYTHKLWLRNIYNRFMKRRYLLMDGFRNSRKS